MIKLDIDVHSGFCFGVKKAIEAASELLKQGEDVYCVGDIVHNEEESKRLNQLGMSIIDKKAIGDISSGTILFRAHGEPPSAYQIVNKAGLKLKDATCPVVLKLQQRIKNSYEQQKKVNGQIVIFGKKGHAEVIGLKGQTNDEAIVIEDESQLAEIDFNRPIELFAQTTKNPDILRSIVKLIEERASQDFIWHNTTCKQVTGRLPRIIDFALKYPLVIFVGGKKSSNAKVLFNACKSANSNSYFVSSEEDVDISWFKKGIDKVGVCGATSTPQWLMEKVAQRIKNLG